MKRLVIILTLASTALFAGTPQQLPIRMPKGIRPKMVRVFELKELAFEWDSYSLTDSLNQWVADFRLLELYENGNVMQTAKRDISKFSHETNLIIENDGKIHYYALIAVSSLPNQNNSPLSNTVAVNLDLTSPPPMIPPPSAPGAFKVKIIE